MCVDYLAGLEERFGIISVKTGTLPIQPTPDSMLEEMLKTYPAKLDLVIATLPAGSYDQSTMLNSRPKQKSPGNLASKIS